MTTTLTEQIALKTIKALSETIAEDYAEDLKSIINIYEPNDLHVKIDALNHRYQLDPRVKIINQNEDILDNSACL